MSLYIELITIQEPDSAPKYEKKLDYLSTRQYKLLNLIKLAIARN